MANTIKIKNSGTASASPASLDYGELAINYADGKLFYKNGSNTIVPFTLASGSGAKLTVSDTKPTSPSSGDLWYESDTGKTFVYYDSFWVEIGHGSNAVVPENITGNAGTATKLETARTISLTGDVTGSVAFDGSANASISSTVNAPLSLTQSSNSASYPLTISSKNQQGGGAGYADIIKLTSTVSGATNPSKHFRINSTGGLEIVNNAYTATTFLLSDAGALTVLGPINQSSYNAGDVIRMSVWSASDMGFTTTYSQATNTYSTIASKTYTPASASSYIFVEVYARYYVNGAAEDSFFSQLTWAGNEFAAQRQVWINGAGGGTRSSTLFPLAGRITNSSPTGYTLAINARRDSADDTLSVYADGAFCVKITEVAR